MDKPSPGKSLPHLSVVILVLSVLYIWSMPGAVLLEDDSYFVLASYFNGVAHPPGYPLYTILGHWFTYIPIESIAFRVHLLSAMFAVATCAVLWYLVYELLNSRFTATVAALGYGLSTVFWSQAIIAEVYTLNTFLFLSLLLLAMQSRRAWSQRRVFLFTLIYGLSIANHWPLILLSTPALLTLLWQRWRQFLSISALTGLLIGLSPYVWMIINSRSDTIISFYGSISTWSDFWFYFSREAYAQNDISLTADNHDRLQFLQFFLGQSLVQFGHAGVLFGITGFLIQWKVLGILQSGSLLLCYLGNSLLLILLLGFDYDLLHQNIFRVYPLLSYAIYIIWIVTGMKFLLDRLSSGPGRKQGLLKAGVSAILLVSILPVSVQANYRANDRWSIDYARAVLDSLDQDAILFTYGDLDQGALVYQNLVKNYRRDVDIYSSKGVLLANRLFSPMHHDRRHINQVIHEFIAQSDRPIYYTYGLPHDFNITDFGIVRRITQHEQPGADKAVLDENSLDYLDYLLNHGLPDDPWKSMHYKLLLNDFCRLLLIINMSQVGKGETSVSEVNAIEQVCSLFPGKLEHIEALLNNNSNDLEKLEELISEAEALLHQSVLKADNARLEYYRGLYFQMKNDVEAASNSFRKSVAIWDHPDNPARSMIR